MGGRFSRSNPEPEQFPVNTEETSKQGADPASEHTDHGRQLDRQVENDAEHQSDVEQSQELVQVNRKQKSSNVDNRTKDWQNITSRVIEPSRAAINVDKDMEASVETPTDNQMLLNDSAAADMDNSSEDNQSVHSEESMDAEDVDNVVATGVRDEECEAMSEPSDNGRQMNQHADNDAEHQIDVVQPQELVQENPMQISSNVDKRAQDKQNITSQVIEPSHATIDVNGDMEASVETPTGKQMLLNGSAAAEMDNATEGHHSVHSEESMDVEHVDNAVTNGVRNVDQCQTMPEPSANGRQMDQHVENAAVQQSDVVQPLESLVQENPEKNSSNVDNRTQDAQNITVNGDMEASVETPTGKQMLLDGSATAVMENPDGVNQSAHSEERMEVDHVEDAVANGVSDGKQCHHVLQGLDSDKACPMEVDDDAKSANGHQVHHQIPQGAQHDSKIGSDEISRPVIAEYAHNAVPIVIRTESLIAVLEKSIDVKVTSGNADQVHNPSLHGDQRQTGTSAEGGVNENGAANAISAIDSKGDENGNRSHPFTIHNILHDSREPAPVERSIGGGLNSTGNPTNAVAIDDEFHDFQDAMRTRIFGTLNSENRSISPNNLIDDDDLDDDLQYFDEEESDEDADSPGAVDVMSMNFDDGFEEEMEIAYNSRKRSLPEEQSQTSAPMTDEEIDEILKAAGVTRFEAGFPESKKTRYEPQMKVDGLEVVDEIPPPSNSDQVESDLQFAIRLHNEEQRRFNRNVNAQCESIPLPPNPPVEKKVTRENQSARQEQEEPVIVHDELLEDEQEDYVVQVMWSMYDECNRNGVRVPRPLSVPGNMNVVDYINGYRRALSEGRFPDIVDVVPLEPSNEDVQVDKNANGPNGVALNNSPTGAGGRLEKTAFGNFLNAASVLVVDVPIELQNLLKKQNGSRKRPSDSDEGETSSKKNENSAGSASPRVPFAERTPPISDDEEHTSEYDECEEDFEIKVCDVPVFKTDDTGFAIPTVPHRGGLYEDCVFNGSFESSPAARRVQVAQKRSIDNLKDFGPERSKYKDIMSRLVDENHTDVVKPSDPVGASTSEHPEDPTDENDPKAAQRREQDEEIDALLEAAFFGKEKKGQEKIAAVVPSIMWLDVENMPPLWTVEKSERLKMPIEYRGMIAAFHRRLRPPPPDGYMKRYLKLMEQIDEEARIEKEDLEGRFVDYARKLTTPAAHIPWRIWGTKFEMYARFPYLKRPYYVQAVLDALNIGRNGGEVMRNNHNGHLSMPEICKKGFNIHMGRRLQNLSVKEPLSDEEMEHAKMVYVGAVKEQFIRDAELIPMAENREGALSYVNSLVHSISRDDIGHEDVAQMVEILYRRKELKKSEVVPNDVDPLFQPIDTETEGSFFQYTQPKEGDSAPQVEAPKKEEEVLQENATEMEPVAQNEEPVPHGNAPEKEEQVPSAPNNEQSEPQVVPQEQELQVFQVAPAKEPLAPVAPEKEPLLQDAPEQEPVPHDDPTKEPIPHDDPAKEPLAPVAPEKKTLLQEDAPEKMTLLQDAPKKEVLLQEVAPEKKPLLQDAPEKEPVPHDDPSKEPVPHDDPSKEPVPQEVAPAKEPVSQEVAPEKESVPHDGPAKEEQVPQVEKEDEQVEAPKMDDDIERFRQMKVIGNAFTYRTDVVAYDIDMVDEDEEVKNARQEPPK